jgi:hypothetical protein
MQLCPSTRADTIADKAPAALDSSQGLGLSLFFAQNHHKAFVSTDMVGEFLKPPYDLQTSAQS